MDEGGQEKKFHLPEIIILVLLALVRDALGVVALLSTAIPLVGIALSGLILIFNLIPWFIIVLWFFFKVGWGWKTAGVQVVAGVLGSFGLPVTTASVIAGISLANYPLPILPKNLPGK